MEKALPYLTTGAPQVEMMSSASFLVCPFETHTWIWIEIIVKYISFFSKWQARASRDIKWARTFLMQSFYFRFPLPGSNDKKIYVWFPPPDKIAPEQAAIARERVPRRISQLKVICFGNSTKYMGSKSTIIVMVTIISTTVTIIIISGWRWWRRTGGRGTVSRTRREGRTQGSATRSVEGQGAGKRVRGR